MKNDSGRTMLVMAALVAASLGFGAPWVSAQSLGELAKQEDARRKAVRKPARVYTNGSLKSVPGEVIPTPPPPKPEQGQNPPQASEGQAQGETPQAADAVPDPRDTREYWKERYDAAVQQRDSNNITLDALQSRINALWMDFTARDDPAQRAVIAADRQKALDELERRKAQQVILEKAIVDIEDEARRAGIPPGWLR